MVTEHRVAAVETVGGRFGISVRRIRSDRTCNRRHVPAGPKWREASGAESIALVPRAVVSAWCSIVRLCQTVVSKRLRTSTAPIDASKHHGLPCDRDRGLYVALIQSGK